MSSMRISIKSLLVISLFTSFLSCSKKNHDIGAELESCRYAGKSYVGQGNYYSSKTTETYNTDIIQTGDRLPLEVKTSSRTLERDTAQNELIKDFAGEYLYQYKYDADGYLLKEISIQNDIQQGGPKFTMFFLDKGPVKKLQTNASRITEFKYENALLTELSNNSTVTYLGDNLPAITKTYNISRKYHYDSQKNLTDTEEVNQDNYKTVTRYKDGLITSIQTTQPSGVIVTSAYKNENGKKTQITSNDGILNFKYDANGNLVKYESIYQGILNLTQEHLYDTHINPETLISSKFKGMPLPFPTVQSHDGMNNMTQQKTTSYNNGNAFVSEQNTSFVYNSSGLPESSASSMITAGGKSTWATTYKYTDCL